MNGLIFYKYDIILTQIIKSQGYPVEEHNIQTSDGFILNVQRIPSDKTHTITAKDNPVVLVQHGLLSSSDCFVMELNNSLAFVLADAGFDVWLGNSRGNVYGRKHIRYNTSQEEFWAWSWDEHAKYDVPATVDYILAATNKTKLFYIGHSQGTVMGFAGFSTNKTLQEKIKLFIALSPIAKLNHIRGFLREIAKPVQRDLKVGCIDV
ncbi:hypothetical protein KUTeg_003499 [Tegillarca granosa]|uniref:Partial AB-hydrolase lipase domain-containing protein n=1 Tax=Tegillarca granosa TaxID=220873 RepID=A0ABQ9FMB6_TEGGR|nr:hypothetical protein KUTeg_003499 [Tegillarca granosa]